MPQYFKLTEGGSGFCVRTEARESLTNSPHMRAVSELCFEQVC